MCLLFLTPCSWQMVQSTEPTFGIRRSRKVNMIVNCADRAEGSSQENFDEQTLVFDEKNILDTKQRHRTAQQRICLFCQGCLVCNFTQSDDIFDAAGGPSKHEQ